MHCAQVEPAGAAVSQTLDKPFERDYIEELAKNREVWAQVRLLAVTQNNSLTSNSCTLDACHVTFKTSLLGKTGLVLHTPSNSGRFMTIIIRATMQLHAL